MAKTANIGRLSVSLEANTASYTKKIKNAQKDTSKYSKKASGDSLKASKKMINGYVAVGAAMIVVTAAAKKMADAYVATEKELRGVAEAAGLTTNELKAQAYALSSTGATVEQLGDNYKDLRDKIGEFAAAGSGAFQDYIDVMGLTTSEGKELAKTLQYMSGPDAMQYLTKEMKKAQVPMSQMVFVMESLGSDSSRTTKMLTENAAAVKSLTEEYKNLSIEADAASVNAFTEATQQTDLFFSNLGALATDALAPAMEVYRDAVKLANSLLPKNAENEFGDYGAEKVEELDSLLTNMKGVEKQKAIVKNLNEELAMSKLILNDMNNSFTEKTIKTSYQTGRDTTIKVVANPEGIEETQVKIKSLEEQIVKTNSVIGSMNAQQVKSQKEAFEKLNKLYVDTTKKTQDTLKNGYYEKKKLLEDSYKAEYGTTKAYQEAEKRLLTAHAKEVVELMKQEQTEKDKIAEENKQKAIAERNAKQELMGLTYSEDSMELLQHNQMLEIQSLTDKYGEELRLKEEFLLAKKALEEKHQLEQKQYADEEIKRTVALNKAKLATEIETMSNIGAALAGFAGDNEKIAMAAFAFNQSVALADMLIQQQAAVANAWGDPSTPWYTKAFVAANAALQVGGAIAQMKNISPQGQAHSGLDEVPKSHDNSTFLLKAGERVIQPEANKDLTAYLNGKKEETAQSGGMVINAPLQLADNAIIDPRQLDIMLVKHRNTIAAAVTKAEKDRPLSRR